MLLFISSWTRYLVPRTRYYTGVLKLDSVRRYP